MRELSLRARTRENATQTTREEPGRRSGGGAGPGSGEQGSGEPGASGVEALRSMHLEDAEVAEMGSVLQLLLRSQV